MDEISRRDLLAGAGTVGAVVGLGLAGATSAGAASHGHHEGKHGGMHGKAAEQDARLAELVDEALDCKEAAEACVRHCISELRAGNGDLADCLDAVLRMKSVVTATAEVAALDAQAAPRTRELASICADFCRDCRKACEPHAKHHAACKACMEACDECIEACQAVVSG